MTAEDEAWCELALALGSTIGELKQRLTFREAKIWFEYRAKHGGFIEPRLAFLLSALNLMTNNAHGGKATLRDFLPSLPEEQDIVIEDADQFMQYLGY